MFVMAPLAFDGAGHPHKFLFHFFKIIYAKSVTEAIKDLRVQIILDRVLNYGLAMGCISCRMNWETRVLLHLAGQFKSLDYLQAQKCRTRAVHHFTKLFTKVDYIVSPTVPDSAYRCQ
jgi:Asp-tRNA(Asn)/Glu-tRNA(Gln) amidotransferase A subunit family amidase